MVNTRLKPAILALALSTGLATQAYAATSSWILNGDGLWSTPSNWNPAEVPNGPGSKAIFDASITASLTILNDANITLGALDIASPLSTAHYSITNDPGIVIRLENNGTGVTITDTSVGTSTDRIYTPLELAENLTVSSASKTLALRGVISESGGVRTITKLGSGYLALENTANTFTGGVIVKAGNLNSPGAGKLGTGDIILGDTEGFSSAGIIGGTTSSSTSAHYTNRIIVASGSTGTKTLRNSGTGRNIMFAGPLELNDNVEISAVEKTGYTRIAGPISGTGGLTVYSQPDAYATNYVRLAGGSTFSGGVRLAAGNLRVGGHDALGTGTLTIEHNTILSSDGNSNRQLTNNVIVAGDFTLGHTNGGAGTIGIWGDVDLGSQTRVVANGGTVSHSFRGNISGTAGLVLQDTNTSNAKYFMFYGNNTYSGGLLLVNGSVQFHGGAALGTGPVTLGDPSTIKDVQLLGNGVVENSISTVPGVSGNRVLFSNDASLPAIFAGSITLGTDLIVGNANNRTAVLAGPVSGTGSITFRGAASDVFGLSGANSYDGTTTISGGTLYITNTTGSATGTGAVTVQATATLAGTGFVGSPTVLETGATLAPGVGNIGTLTFNNGLTLSAGSTNVMDVDKTLGTFDVVAASSISFDGTLVVNDVAGTLANGDTFKLFSASGASTGKFSEVVLLNTTLQGEFNPATGVLSIIGDSIANYPTNITVAVTSAGLSLAWPETHKGWVVQSNSVDVADSASWYTVEGSAAGTTLTVPVNATTPKVFYRLAKP